jgi:hypothetical protein
MYIFIQQLYTSEGIKNNKNLQHSNHNQTLHFVQSIRNIIEL